MAITDTIVKITDAEIADVMRNPIVRRYLRGVLRKDRWREDPRDGAPCGWADVFALVRALDFEAQS